MKGKKKILAALPGLNADELELIYRDVRRAADVAAIGGASMAEWNQYIEVANEIVRELKRRFPDRRVGGYLEKEPGEIDSLKAVYMKIFKKRKAKDGKAEA